jgi:hypothetical protein
MTPTTTKSTPAKQATTKTAGMTPRAAFDLGREVLAKQPSETRNQERLSSAYRKIQQQVQDSLESSLNDFLESSNMEEKRFMIGILRDRDSIGITSEAPRGPSDHFVPLYSAVHEAIEGVYCVAVPDLDMLSAVENFITELDRKSYKRQTNADISANGIKGRWERSFRTEVELFARDAGTPSLRFMSAIIARWNEIRTQPGAEKMTCILGAAAEIELEKLQAEQAAENATMAAV